MGGHHDEVARLKKVYELVQDARQVVQGARQPPFLMMVFFLRIYVCGVLLASMVKRLHACVMRMMKTQLIGV